ncbi:unnamed protein product [Acanthoscelides obtectus]|uniref:Uncharacterized protein n=1 Tax=Acanthoscelides obtectus TaxID=200917 RepID=A0A9P0P4L5_ACAOB|nr:unnamed protein product [Acanthoscelides obtectus]CAK1643000.1 hypothetical protein AOBTE_LOCUS13353 [Acanthoscelides obtectus]
MKISISLQTISYQKPTKLEVVHCPQENIL